MICSHLCKPPSRDQALCHSSQHRDPAPSVLGQQRETGERGKERERERGKERKREGEEGRMSENWTFFSP